MSGDTVFRYRFHDADGEDLGESAYAVPINAGDELLIGNGRRLRVLSIVTFDDEESPFMGSLQIEPA